MTPEQLQRYAPAVPGAAAQPEKPTATAPPVLMPAAAPSFASERWERVALLPGLELMVRADASSAVRRLAQEIHDHCCGAAPVRVAAS